MGATRNINNIKKYNFLDKFTDVIKINKAIVDNIELYEHFNSLGYIQHFRGMPFELTGEGESELLRLEREITIDKLI